MLFIGICFFGAISVLVKSSEKIVVPLCFGPMMLLCLFEFVSTGYKITLTNDEISTHWFGRKKRIRWDEISSVSNRNIWGDLKLQSSDSSYSLRVDSQVEGYSEVVKLIEYKRPDLFDADIPDTFHWVIWGQLFLGGIGSFIVAMGIKGILEHEMGAGLGLLALGLLTLSIVFTQTRTVALQDNDLVLKSLLRERRLKAQDIEAIYIDTASSGYGSVAHPITIRLTKGKTISLGGFREGPAMLYQALQAWWQRNTSLGPKSG